MSEDERVATIATLPARMKAAGIEPPRLGNREESS